MDKQFYCVKDFWIQDQIHQGHYNVFLKPGATNLAKYFTKHHLPHHHCCMRSVYIHCSDNGINASLRVFNSSQNASLNEIPKQDKRKETHL